MFCSDFPPVDYFSVLNVPPSFSPADFQNSALLLAPRLHPDKLRQIPGDVDASELFVLFTVSRSVLSDPLALWAFQLFGLAGVRAVEKFRPKMAGLEEKAKREKIKQLVEQEKISDLTMEIVRSSEFSVFPLSASAASRSALNSWRLLGFQQRRPENLMGLKIPETLDLFDLTFFSSLSSEEFSSAAVVVASLAGRFEGALKLSESVEISQSTELSRDHKKQIAVNSSIGIGKQLQSGLAIRSALRLSSTGRFSLKFLVKWKIFSAALALPLPRGLKNSSTLKNPLGSAKRSPVVFEPEITKSFKFLRLRHNAACRGRLPLTALKGLAVAIDLETKGLGKEKKLRSLTSVSVSGSSIDFSLQFDRAIQLFLSSRVFVKFSLNFPVPAEPRQLSLSPSIEGGATFPFSSGHSAGASLAVGPDGVFLLLRYKLPAFAFSAPLQLTPKFQTFDTPAALFSSLALIIAGRLLYERLEKRRQQRDFLSSADSLARAHWRARGRAMAEQSKMAEKARIKAKHSKLVIISAKYSFNADSGDSDDSSDSPDCLDVTIPIQTFVQDDQLVLEPGPRGDLPGFFFPCAFVDYRHRGLSDFSLEISYRLAGQTFLAKFDDREKCQIPQENRKEIQNKKSKRKKREHDRESSDDED